MKNRFFTKFCGITNANDALNAQKLGCNALGFVFVKKSKRYISPSECQKIINQLNPNILIVALFADNSVNEIKDILNKCAIHVLQFHGFESQEFCSQFNRPYWKAIPMADNINPVDYSKKYFDAQAYLIDNYGSHKMGGSGTIFNWKNLPQNINSKWILAGGLNTSNIQTAINKTKIRSFDISSGIEKSPGIKSKSKMKQFLKNLNKNR